MVTILPKESDWSDTFQSIGQGVTQGYQTRADEMALQKAIGDLGDKPTPRQILDAVTGTRTYSPAAKQNAFKNYLGAAQFEETQRHARASEEATKERGIRENKINEAKIAESKVKNQGQLESNKLKSEIKNKEIELANLKLEESKRNSIEEHKFKIEKHKLDIVKSESAIEKTKAEIEKAQAEIEKMRSNSKNETSKIEESIRKAKELAEIAREKNKIEYNKIESSQKRDLDQLNLKRQSGELSKEQFEFNKKNIEENNKLKKDRLDFDRKKNENEIFRLEENKRHAIATEDIASSKAKSAEYNIKLKETQAINKQKEKELQDKKDAISLIDNSELPQEEKEELVRDVEAGRQSYRSIKSITKPKTSKEVNQPIDAVQLNKIKEVRDNPEFENASAPKKYQMLTDNGVSRVNAESEVAIYAEEDKLSHEKQKEARKEEVRFHEQSQKFDDSLEKESKSAKSQLGAIADTREALQSGKIKPTSLTNVFRALGPKGERIATALLSKEEAVLEASIPAFLEGRKELFGVRLSDADLKLLQNKLPDIGKSREANGAILNLMEKYSKQAILREKIGREIKDKNKGLRPVDYQSRINERFEEMTAPVRVKNPASGKISSIPAYEVSSAIEAGGVLVDE